MTRARDVANVLTAANVLSTDVETAAEAMGVRLKLNHKYIYSANHCPIK